MPRAARGYPNRSFRRRATSMAVMPSPMTVNANEFGLGVFPHRLAWTRGAPCFHHVLIGARTLGDPAKELDHQQTAAGRRHFFSAAVQLSTTLMLGAGAR